MLSAESARQASKDAQMLPEIQALVEALDGDIHAAVEHGLRFVVRRMPDGEAEDYLETALSYFRDYGYQGGVRGAMDEVYLSW